MANGGGAVCNGVVQCVMGWCSVQWGGGVANGGGAVCNGVVEWQMGVVQCVMGWCSV